MKKIEIKDRPQLSIAWDTNHRPSVTNQKLNLNRRRLGHARFPALQAVCLVLLLLVIIFFFSDWLLSWLILNQRKATLKKIPQEVSLCHGLLTSSHLCLKLFGNVSPVL